MKLALGGRGDRLGADRFAVLGAQGPDLFLHNQRTEPSGLRFGVALHAKGYGSYVRALAEAAVKAGAGADSPEAAYVYAYASHAFLDRAVHPFIACFAGFVDPRDPGTGKYAQMHAFFERIIDVLCFERSVGADLGGYDFFGSVDCGAHMPPSLVALNESALLATRGVGEAPETIRKKIENAYSDTMNIYRLTNPPDTENRERAREHDGRQNSRKKFLALFHPAALPTDIDFANAARAAWRDPLSDGTTRNESLWDLFDAAEGKAVPALRLIADVFAGKAAADGIAAAVGEGNLSNGKEGRASRKKFMEPLPLPELLDSLIRGGR
jgi:hypothetical protein